MRISNTVTFAAQFHAFLLWVPEDPRSVEYLQDFPDYPTLGQSLEWQGSCCAAPYQTDPSCFYWNHTVVFMKRTGDNRVRLFDADFTFRE